MTIDDKTRTELEAAVFRRLVEHLRARTDVQNIDLMNLAGFCRNCLGRLPLGRPLVAYLPLAAAALVALVAGGAALAVGAAQALALVPGVSRAGATMSTRLASCSVSHVRPIGVLPVPGGSACTHRSRRGVSASRCRV